MKKTIENKWVVQHVLPDGVPTYYAGNRMVDSHEIARFEPLSSDTRTYDSEFNAKQAMRRASTTKAHT